ncbi:MAG TPA: nickel pincer cofactor biosynthesis protein LarB, partial [Gemmatimonadaceae bacterium]|nr:nickel pincer cofactor biosynthesis protein LarB [Gemmatimonadaceae bacterium]
RTSERQHLASLGSVMTQVRWDRDREQRTGVPEVVYGPGKTAAHLRQIFENTSELRIASRLSDDQMAVLADLATIHSEARMAVRNGREKRNIAVVPVITAGTADIPVALEAAVTLDAMGVPVSSHFDVGVAGIHRLQSILPEISNARVCIVVAGMDGALPAVVAGLVRAPVIGVPTSVGTGVAQGGMVALNTMLASCSPGVAVVNIDNGFGAACLALKILGFNIPD